MNQKQLKFTHDLVKKMFWAKVKDFNERHQEVTTNYMKFADCLEMTLVEPDYSVFIQFNYLNILGDGYPFFKIDINSQPYVGYQHLCDGSGWGNWAKRLDWVFTRIEEALAMKDTWKPGTKWRNHD